MVCLVTRCDCKTCLGSSRNDPAYAEMNKRIDAGEFVMGGWICNCRCHGTILLKQTKRNATKGSESMGEGLDIVAVTVINLNGRLTYQIDAVNTEKGLSFRIFQPMDEFYKMAKVEL